MFDTFRTELLESLVAPAKPPRYETTINEAGLQAWIDRQVELYGEARRPTKEEALSFMVAQLAEQVKHLRDELRVHSGSEHLEAFIARGVGAKTSDGEPIETFREILAWEFEGHIGPPPGIGYTARMKGDTAISFIRAPCKCDIYIAGRWAGGTQGATDGEFLRLHSPLLIARTDTVEVVCEDPKARIEVVGRRVTTAIAPEDDSEETPH